jgi:hypothetical protein
MGLIGFASFIHLVLHYLSVGLAGKEAGKPQRCARDVAKFG